MIEYAGVWKQGFERNDFIPYGNWVPDSLDDFPVFINSIGFSKLENPQIWKYIKESGEGIKSFFSEKSKDSTNNFFIKGKGWQ